MPGLGTIINTAAIVVGGLLGLLFKNLLTKSMEDTLLKASSVCVLFIGIGGAMQHMLKITDGTLETSGSMMLIICFVLGSIVGELLDIEGAFERFGAWLRKKTHNESDTGFLSAFIHASLTVCIGAMAIVGSIQDGLLGDSSLLCAKAALDAVIILVMTASMGKGCIFSAIFTEAAIANLSYTGSVMIFCVGLNLVWGKKIKVANLLPTLVFAVLYALVF